MADQWQSGFSVIFASPDEHATPSTVKFIIEPDPGDVDYFINEWEGNYDVYVSFPLEPNTVYTVTIPGSCGRSLWQHARRGLHVELLRAAVCSALASLNLPREVAQLSTAFPTSVEVLYRNVDQFDVSLYDIGLNIDLLINTYQQFDNPTHRRPDFPDNRPVYGGQR